ncbi:hypothetical protein RJT34_14092 [Clitoria ternatea]|uniref:Protein kinase domain-containing protein n=1 Tax=Clitoria ternatea TaxID=43366 RepID=A0AAN9JPS1_CLITE
MIEWVKLRILGKGSSGTVSLVAIVAPQEWKCKLVAMKSSMPHSIVSLVREKRIMGLFIGCKEIVQCYFDQLIMEQGNLSYNLFLDYAPYGSLGDSIRKKQLLDNQVRIYTGMILKGLSCIHQKGVVHCDLKPDNILLFPSTGHAWSQLKISDFGLSKTKEETINHSYFWNNVKFRGTPLYMSPESLFGQIEAPLDIWSLGCIVIEMITGRVWKDRFQTLDDLVFKLAFLQEAPEIPTNLSWDCKHFLSKCFMKDPAQRWTAEMLLNHPFVSSISEKQEGYQKFPGSGLSFFSYDVFDYLPLKV